MKKILTRLAAAFLALNLSAQVFTDASAFPVYGKASDATKTRYQRLPAALEGVSRPAVWRLGTQSAGLYIRFRSNSTSIRQTIYRGHPYNYFRSYRYMYNHHDPVLL